MQNFMLDLLKKNSLKKIKFSRSLPDPEHSWWGHQQQYNFFLVFADFRETKIRPFEAAKLAELVDHDITLKILEFILNSIEKIKPVFS